MKPGWCAALESNRGSQTVQVNQSIHGGQWISIGTFPFAAGTAGAVRLTADPSALICTVADAVQWATPVSVELSRFSIE